MANVDINTMMIRPDTGEWCLIVAGLVLCLACAIRTWMGPKQGK